MQAFLLNYHLKKKKKAFIMRVLTTVIKASQADAATTQLTVCDFFLLLFKQKFQHGNKHLKLTTTATKTERLF